MSRFLSCEVRARETLNTSARRPHLRTIFRAVSTAALLSAACSAAVHAQAIEHVKAVFAVEINNKETQGENRLDIHRKDGRYFIDFELDHWMVAASQKASFEMDQCSVHPLSYTDSSKRPFKDRETQKLKFDWAAKKVYYSSVDEQRAFELDATVYDPISFFFEARCELMAGKQEFTFPIIRRGSRREQHFRVVGRQVVPTGLGEFEALVVERDRKNRKRQTRLYVAPALDYLLVRIEHQESPLLKAVATLQSMDYRLATESD